MKKTRNLISTISTLVILNGCSLHRENLTNINYPPKSIEYNMGFEYKGTIGSIVYLFLAEQIESKNYKISITPIKLRPNFNLEEFKKTLDEKLFKPINLLKSDFDSNGTITHQEAKYYYILTKNKELEKIISNI